jgi:signal transduction histidine kinase
MTGVRSDRLPSVPESSDKANPTGTTSAATRAAIIMIRYRFRMSPISPVRVGQSFRPDGTDSSSAVPWKNVECSAPAAVGAAITWNTFSQVGRPHAFPACARLVQVTESPTSSIESRYARLLSLAVHEFRTPASVVGGYLRMLQRDNDPPLAERHRKMVEEAEKSCARLVALIAELGEVSKFDAGLAPLKREPFDLFALLHEVASSVHEAEDRGVRLEVRGPKSGAATSGDPTRIGSAFTAIYRAVLREQPTSTVVVADIRQGHRALPESMASSAVVVVARDTEAQAAHDAPAADFDEKRGGLGLALPIARRVIEGHGGRMWSPAAANGADNSRSAILVALPLGAAAQHTSPSPSTGVRP